MTGPIVPGIYMGTAPGGGLVELTLNESGDWWCGEEFVADPVASFSPLYTVAVIAPPTANMVEQLARDLVTVFNDDPGHNVLFPPVTRDHTIGVAEELARLGWRRG